MARPATYSRDYVCTQRREEDAGAGNVVILRLEGGHPNSIMVEVAIDDAPVLVERGKWYRITFEETAAPAE